MRSSRRRKHRAETTPDRAHAKAGLTALGSVLAVITVVLVTVGSVFAPSGAATGRIHHYPIKIIKGVKTVTATATVTATVPGPTKTVTATRTIWGPSASATVATTSTATPSATATSTPSGTRQLPYVGAAIQGNGDPAALEAASGRTLGLHRTYWNYNRIAASIKQATADAKAGRIPWLSYKLSVSWADAAAGKADADTQTLAAQLATVPGTVWVAIHHEPDSDGNIADWVALQRRLLPILGAVPNVRTTIILNGWGTFESGNPEYSLDAVWPGNMVDILGVDGYNPYGDDKHPTSGWREMSQYYDKIAPAALKLGVDWAIGETGYTDAAAAKDPDWLTRAYDDMANRTDLPGLGLCYFDSSANSIGTWPLSGVKEAQFSSILKRSHPVTPPG